MKQCLKCNRTYTDDTLNFCLEDGEMLVAPYQNPPPPPQFSQDPPPTVMMNEARVTNPASWPEQPSASPPAPWQGQQMAGAQGGLPMAYAMASPSQALAVTSLGLGIASVTIGWCCWVGMLLSPAALITGFIALSQIKKDPRSYGGRGFAIGGIVTGVIYISILILILVIYGAAIIGGGLSSIN
jgi:hypothetical protein